ncbi:MAG: non-canonical purine NTP pyrophosphatase [Chloroflexota bacterium]
MKLAIATSNVNKVNQIESHLGRPLQQIDIDLPEIQAVQVRDVIEEKTRTAFEQVGHPVLVEDTGLYIHAWNGLPGALIRWFLKSVGTQGICQMLAEFEDRSAKAETCIGFCDGNEFHCFSGTVEGSIARSPRGDYGFGWDPIFIPSGSDKTFAEVPPEEKLAIDMRRVAALELKSFLMAR